ncbi:hypothetical protein N0O92_18385 [Alkalihalobacillus sp. MEB130]|uniref:hypothetical protein n=1 Tax=Alkalihalobacillus sp. MEB130 TaxID=2976704 RepID=UPI0028E044A2|nr:hypothetical protein [Alkalihalobacillus sp. MEB130]MDT8862182.1 hypothetical protein [Alkalihalobacillus sp. MEB130]
MLAHHPYDMNVFYPIQNQQLDYDERFFGPMFPPLGGGPGFPVPPSPPPTGQGQEAGPPTTPPPAFVPAQTQQVEAFAVDPGSIRRCLFRFTYVWLRNRQQFWFYPTFIGRRSISGFRWTGSRWVYFGISLQEIQSFTCV